MSTLKTTLISALFLVSASAATMADPSIDKPASSIEKSKKITPHKEKPTQEKSKDNDTHVGEFALPLIYEEYKSMVDEAYKSRNKSMDNE